MKNEEKACLLNALIAVRYLGKESVRCRPHTEGKAEVVRGKLKRCRQKKKFTSVYISFEITVSAVVHDSY